MATFEQKDVIDTLIGFKHYIKNTSFLGGKDVIKQICTTKELLYITLILKNSIV